MKTSAQRFDTQPWGPPLFRLLLGALAIVLLMAHGCGGGSSSESAPPSTSAGGGGSSPSSSPPPTNGGGGGSATGSPPPPTNVGGGGSPSGSPPPPIVLATTAFPLEVSANKRYLQDQNGKPFPILGRTAWFITSLSEADYKAFIDDTVAKGYNSIEFHVINHDPRGNNPPYAGNGEAPFTNQQDGSNWNRPNLLSYGNIATDAPDFSTPNEAYWKHVDALVTYAESKGVLCFMFAAYTGFQGGDQGWMKEMVENGTAKIRAYGAFIADRYKSHGNIVWMLGGDHGTGPIPDGFTSQELAVEQEMLRGLQSVSGQLSKQFSAEWSSNSIYTDQPDPTLNAAGTLQGAYSFSGEVSTYVRNAYTASTVMPSFLLEEPYDEEGPDGNGVNSNATQPVRRYQWWGWLSGIGGYVSGNGCVWPFNPASFSPFSFCNDGWKAHLDTPGAQDMARLNAFIRSIAWFNLVPSGIGGMPSIVIGGSTPGAQDYIAAAATLDQTLLVAYVPPAYPGTSFTIDMARMTGSVRARWFDPSNGTYLLIGMFASGSPQSFTPPGLNSIGDTDWVLLLETQ